MSQPQQKKRKLSPKPTTRPAVESCCHRAIRTNFVRIAGFLTHEDTKPITPLAQNYQQKQLGTCPLLLAMRGQVQALHFNLVDRKCKIPLSLLAEAAARFDKELVLFYLKRRHFFFPSHDLTQKMAVHGATKCLLSIVNCLPVRSAETLANCARSGNLDHFKRVRLRGFPLSHNCVTEAIRSGSLEMVKHLMSIDCTHRPRLSALAATEFGSLEMILFLMSRRVSFPPIAHAVAVQQGRTRVTDLLIDYGVKPHSSAIHSVIIKRDHETLAKFINRAKFTLSNEFVVTAAAAGCPRILKMLKDHSLRFSPNLISMFPAKIKE